MESAKPKLPDYWSALGLGFLPAIGALAGYFMTKKRKGRPLLNLPARVTQRLLVLIVETLLDTESERDEFKKRVDYLRDDLDKLRKESSEQIAGANETVKTLSARNSELEASVESLTTRCLELETENKRLAENRPLSPKPF